MALQLLGRHPDQLGVAVAQGEHPGPGQEVDEDVAVDVPHEAARRLGQGDRQVAGVGAALDSRRRCRADRAAERGPVKKPPSDLVGWTFPN